MKLTLWLYRWAPPFCLNLAVPLPSESAANLIVRDGVNPFSSPAKLKVFGSANKVICVLQCSNRYFNIEIKERFCF